MYKQPKQKGTYKHWVNVHNDDADKPVCVNWDHVTDWNEIPVVSEVVPHDGIPVVTEEVVPHDNNIVNDDNVEVLITNSTGYLPTAIEEAKRKEIEKSRK